MECIRYINWNYLKSYSLQIDIKDIDEDVFKKWLVWFYVISPHKPPILTISPTHAVKGDRICIDKYISLEDLIEDGKIQYEAISILGKEIGKLIEHWSKQDQYKDFVMLSNNLDKLID